FAFGRQPFGLPLRTEPDSDGALAADQRQPAPDPEPAAGPAPAAGSAAGGWCSPGDPADAAVAEHPLGRHALPADPASRPPPARHPPRRSPAPGHSDRWSTPAGRATGQPTPA